MSRARHFRFAEMAAETPKPGIARRRVIGDKAMAAEIRLAKGAAAPMHSHPEEQIAVVLEGRLRFTLADGEGGAERVVEVGPGEAVVLPGGVPHAAEALEDARVIDVFAPPPEKMGIDG